MAGNNHEKSTASAKAAHVNMMTDTIIANLPTSALRSILRSLLGVDEKVTPAFHSLAASYLDATKPRSIPKLVSRDTNVKNATVTEVFWEWQSRYRCLMGVGRAFESVDALREVVEQFLALGLGVLEVEGWEGVLAGLDSDIIQAVTAVQKELKTDSGFRQMSISERRVLEGLRDALAEVWGTDGVEIPFQRARASVETLFRSSIPRGEKKELKSAKYSWRESSLETTQIGNAKVPRIFMGLWQFSSPAWGTASRKNIDEGFRRHVDKGFVAYDMADHYGDAEVTFGNFRSKQADANHIFCTTKWCIFEPTTITQDVVNAAITERLVNINAERLELLQFHWQDYKDKQYVKAAKMIADDPRVDNLGLCNFDTEHVEEIIESGVNVVSNQVQFSLIDLRPTFKMAESCRKRKVKLLTYGSLCGGLLAEKWLGVPAPDLFEASMTPSTRKYLEMINVWGGWSLFQDLLTALSTISHKWSVSISTVAVRWVLDHDYVGAVIIGARMGISEHVEDNEKVFGWQLDDVDHEAINEVLRRSQAKEVMDAMGDCGAEYR